MNDEVQNAEVWKTSTAGRVKVTLPNGVKEVPSPLTAEELRRLCREEGLSRFTVENVDGVALTPSDFPITDGEVVVKEYNEVK